MFAQHIPIYSRYVRRRLESKQDLEMREYLIKSEAAVIPFYVILTVRGNLFRIFKSFMKHFTRKKREVD